MMQHQKREIAVLAEIIRDGLELSTPINVEDAVKRLGGKLVEKESMEAGMEAMVRRDGERFEIIIQKNKPAVRKRFSVAHELGHLFLHMGYLVNPDLWSNTDEYRDSVYYRFGHGIEEEEANEFAANFLMPENEFQEVAGKHIRDGYCSVEGVASHFRTSKDAALIRGRSIGVFRGS
jgi:Zn-dependent peptidase ImmA (M78 family)